MFGRDNIEFSVNKHGVWSPKTAQTFDFRRAENVVMGVLKKPLQ